MEQEVLALEPWECPAFLADLEAFAEGGRELSRRFAADAVLLARMAALVPRAEGDTRGATAWTSFLGEVAVARRVSVQLAGSLVAEALHLVRLLPTALRLLESGDLPVPRAKALVEATVPCPDELARLLDEQLAARAVDLSPARIRAEVDRLALQHEVDAAAQRAARASAGRGTRRTPLPDGQAEHALRGPAAVLAQVDRALDADARAWRAALRGTGDRRGIDQLRFDLAVHRLLGHHGALVASAPACAPGRRAADSAQVDPPAGSAAGSAADLPADLPVPLPDPTLPSWWTDRRFSRPVRLDVQVPVTTALGLADEPGWLPGYGWLCAPLVRQLLPVAELRQWCVAADGEGAGRLVDLSSRVVRPGSLPAARRALVAMAEEPFPVSGTTWRTQQEHDPSPALAEFVRLRDAHCDSPLAATPVPAVDAGRADLDHDLPYDAAAREDQPTDRPDRATAPVAARARWGRRARRHRRLALARRGWSWGEGDLRPAGATADGPGAPQAGTGPTAAWNLCSRGRRMHGLKHRGWIPLRHASGTTWLTPAGQVVEVPQAAHPVGGVVRPLVQALARHEHEAALLKVPDQPAWLEQPDDLAEPSRASAGRRLDEDVEPDW